MNDGPPPSVENGGIPTAKEPSRHLSPLTRVHGVLRAHPNPVRFLLARFLTSVGASRFFLIRRRGYRLRFHPTSLSRTLWSIPGSRVREEAFFRQYLRQGDVVVDVGANIGTLTLAAAARVGATGKVFAFEPHPRTYAFLIDNIRLNAFTNVYAKSCALGETKGEVTFTDGSQDDQNKVGSEGALKVRLSKLDDEIDASLTSIALLKVDVEGYEKFVLEGAELLLDRVQCIFFEANEAHYQAFGYSTSDLISFLNGKGFTCLAFATGAPEPLSPDFVATSNRDLIAVRDEQRLRERLRTV